MDATAQRRQWQIFVIGAAFMAVIVAIASGRLPRWLRYATHATTLTIAAGSLDGDAPKLISAIATRLASTGAPVHLKVLDKGSIVEATRAFSAGETDLAIVRSDVGDLSNAETVVVVTHGVVLIIAPPGSPITSMDDLKSKTVVVVGGEANQKVVEALTKEYDLERLQTHFKDLAIADIPQALKSKQVNALLVVMPLSEKYLTMLRAFFPRTAKQKPAVIPIEAAGAITAVARSYKTYDLPKGTLQGSPPIPDDDMKTLRVPLYLVANKKLSDDVVGSLTKAIMDARRDLLGEYPLLAQIREPDTDKTDTDNDTYIPVHPGAVAYFGGDQKSFFDKHGDQIFYGSMLLGTLSSIFAAGWKFMAKSEEKPESRPLMRLYALTDRIGKAKNEDDLAEAERHIDGILRGELEKYAVGEAEPSESAALSLATHRLEYLITQRRALFNAKGHACLGNLDGAETSR